MIIKHLFSLFLVQFVTIIRQLFIVSLYFQYFPKCHVLTHLCNNKCNAWDISNRKYRQSSRNSSTMRFSKVFHIPVNVSLFVHTETCQWFLYSAASFSGSISISRPVSQKLYCVTKVVDVACYCEFLETRSIIL